MAGKSQRERILQDIKEFEENVKKVEETQENAKVIDLAKRYAKDAGYFLEKGDEFTAWGCANYAHGLLDALRDLKSLKKSG